MKVFTAPEPPDLRDHNSCEIFLAGSIEQGKARDWQVDVINAVKDLNVTIFNPRRKNWDAKWSEDITNPELVAQINWELDNINRSEIILFYLQEGTLSPISLLELGLTVQDRRKDIVVVCEDGFWRAGNVVVTSKRNNIMVLKTLDGGIERLLKLIKLRSI